METNVEVFVVPESVTCSLLWNVRYSEGTDGTAVRRIVDIKSRLLFKRKKIVLACRVEISMGNNEI